MCLLMKKCCKACLNEKIFSCGYCYKHYNVLKNLQKHYKTWSDVYSNNISWDRYLIRLLKLKDTGIYVKEVINAELKKKEKK